MHLLVAKPVINGAGRVQFESVHPHVHKGGQVVRPMLQSGLRPAFTGCYQIFFYDTVVIFFAQPESQVYAHTAEFPHEQARIELLGHLVLEPVGFGRELVVVPALRGREIVAFLHPLRL